MQLSQADKAQSIKIMSEALKIAPEKNCRDCCSKCPLKQSRDIEYKTK